MKLSIGMIVKNEEKYLRRCLESLVPILRQVDSELIIADTGSTDRSFDIAKEFTPNVFHFQWCDDFAAARNATLKRAKGEWFMAVDADEIFEDTSEIISFFNSGEYKKFNSATFIQRNFNSRNRKSVSDFNAPRMTKITRNTFYISPIHETLSTFGAPVKTLSAVAIHYGYVTEDNREFIRQKAERNLKLLFRQLEKKPCDHITLYHISQTYCLLLDYKNALEYCEKGLHFAKEQSSSLQFSLYATKVSILYFTARYPEALNVIEEYFGSKSGAIGTDLEMYYLRAECLRMLNREGAIAAYQKYLKFFKEYRSGLHHTVDTRQHSVNFISDASYRDAVYRLTELLINRGEYESASGYSQTVRIADWTDDRQYLTKRLSQEIRLMKNTGDFSNLIKLYGQLGEKSVGILQGLIENEMPDATVREQILKAFRGCGLPKTEYLRTMEIRFKYYCSKTLRAQDLADFLSETERFGQFYADILYLALFFKLPIESLAKKVDAFDLENNFTKIEAFHFEDLPALIFDLSQSDIGMCDANTLLWLSYLYLWALLSNGLETGQAISLFETYARTFDAYMAAVFKEEVMAEGNAHLLPKPFRAGYYCGLALKAREAGRDAEYIRHLKSALRLEPKLVGVIKALLEEFQKKRKERENREKLSELETYALRVKQNIAFLIDNGKISEAAGLLAAYGQLCPDDADIPALKRRLAT